jgi:hypothetical protein
VVEEEKIVEPDYSHSYSLKELQNNAERHETESMNRPKLVNDLQGFDNKKRSKSNNRNQEGLNRASLSQEQKDSPDKPKYSIPIPPAKKKQTRTPALQGGTGEIPDTPPSFTNTQIEEQSTLSKNNNDELLNNVNLFANNANILEGINESQSENESTQRPKPKQ